jgi:PAS domain S-box-containing protein
VAGSEDGATGWLLERRELATTIELVQLLLVRHAAVYMTVSLVCALLLWGLFKLVFHRRVEALRYQMQRAIEGETGARVTVAGRDELATIMRDFNRTMESIEEALALLRKREDALQESTTALLGFQRALDEHAISSVTDPAGNIVFANELFCTISGYSREELLGQNHRLLKSGAHSPAFYQDMWQTISSGRTWRGLLQNHRRDGSAYWVQSTIVPQLDDKG